MGFLKIKIEHIKDDEGVKILMMMDSVTRKYLFCPVKRRLNRSRNVVTATTVTLQSWAAATHFLNPNLKAIRSELLPDTAIHQNTDRKMNSAPFLFPAAISLSILLCPNHQF